MSGSLARLVLRAQGRLPVAEPLLPSRYAPAGPAEPPAAAEPGWPDPAIVPAQPPSPSPPAATVPPLAPARPPSPRPETEDAPAPPAPVVTSASIRPAPSPPPTPFEERPIRVEAVRPAPAIAPASTRPDGREPAPATASAPPQTAGERYSAERAEPPFVVARRTTLASPPTEARTDRAIRAAMRAPDVHISIGRVEVHAAPAPPAPVRRGPARQPARSLADYLTRRGAERR
jgi:hypothetical protein